MNTETFFLIFGPLWYFTTLFFHSTFFHKYGAHQYFKFSNIYIERIYWFFVYITLGASYMCAIAYAKMHLAHHKFSDKDGDPHSPRLWDNFLIGIWPMMAKTFKILNEIRLGRHKIAKMWQHRSFPSWPKFEKIAESAVSMHVFILLYIAIYYFFVPTPWLWPLIFVQIFSGAIQGALVNWFGHKKGYRNYHTDDNSRNTFRVDILGLGECYQNNHHGDVLNPNFARRWYEVDFAYQGLRVLAFLGLIRWKPRVA